VLDCRCARGKHPDARHHQRESTKMPKCQGACPKRDCDQHWVNAKSRSELRVVDCEARAGGALLHGMPWGAPGRSPNKTRPFLEPVRPREVGEDSGCSSEGLAHAPHGERSACVGDGSISGAPMRCPCCAIDRRANSQIVSLHRQPTLAPESHFAWSSPKSEPSAKGAPGRIVAVGAIWP